MSSVPSMPKIHSITIVAIGHRGLERYEQIHYELGSINKFNGQFLGHIATIEIEVFKTCLLLR